MDIFDINALSGLVFFLFGLYFGSDLRMNFPATLLYTTKVEIAWSISRPNFPVMTY